MPPMLVYQKFRSYARPKGGGRLAEEMSIPDAARILGVTDTAIRQRIARGKLTVVREERHGEQVRRFVDAAEVRRQAGRESEEPER